MTTELKFEYVDKKEQLRKLTWCWKVYTQKVKHLEYEHKNSLKKIDAHNTSVQAKDADEHKTEEGRFRNEKIHLRSQIRTRERQNAEEIADTKAVSSDAT